MNLAMVYYELNELHLAHSLLMEASKLSHELGYPLGEGESAANMSLVEFNMGNIEQAKLLERKGIKILKSLNNRKWTDLQNQLDRWLEMDGATETTIDTS